MKKTINTKRLKMAEIRYFDMEHNGVELIDSDDYAYAILVNVNGSYVNLFNPSLELPVYERMPYTNTTANGEDYGNLIQHLDGEERDGPCYLINNTNLEYYFGKRDVTIDEIEKYMFSSNKFFVDRLDMYTGKSLVSRVRTMDKSKVKDDEMRHYKLEKYFNEHEKNKMLKK